MATHSRILACRIPMDRGVCWAKFHGVAASQMQLSTAQHMYIHWQFHYVYLHLNISSKALFTFLEEENGIDGNISCKQIKMSVHNKCWNWSFRNGQPTSKLTNCMINLVFCKRSFIAVDKYFSILNSTTVHPFISKAKNSLSSQAKWLGLTIFSLWASRLSRRKRKKGLCLSLAEQSKW